MERLQKVIAQSGFCSRRKAEEYIKNGKVKVNGIVCDTLGTKVSGGDIIEVNGKPISSREDYVYYIINKPKGCICTVKDQFNRKTVLDYLPDDKRIFPVGRLDYDTSGILLVTNDGNFSNLMTHPRYHLPKTYQVNVQGILSDDDVKALRKGLVTKEDSYQPAKVLVRQKDYTRDRTLLDLTIQEGKNHQVKKMMEALGHEVRKLHRKKFGFLTADDMRAGEYRKLKPYEYKMLVEQAKNGIDKE